MSVKQVQVTPAQQIAARYLLENDAAKGRPLRPALVLIAEAEPDGGDHPEATVILRRS